MDIEILEKTIIEDKQTQTATDCIIVGGGPAGIIASQYLLRDGIQTMIFEPRELARKIVHHDVHFLPGVSETMKGPQLAATLRQKVTCPVIKEAISGVISLSPRKQLVVTKNGHNYYARTVLIATGLRKRNTGLPNEEDFRSRGVYIALDAIPNTECIKDLVTLDKDGFITTEDNLMTSVPGIFAAGDVRTKYLRQVITATADGATAGLSIVNHLRG